MAQSQTDRNGASTTPPTTPAGLQAAIDASAASATASAASATAAATSATASATSAADAAAQLATKASLTGATFTGGVNLARSSIAQHATTMNLGALSNTVDGTGSAVTVTAIVNAPQAGIMPATGAWRSGSAAALHAVGRGFESLSAHHFRKLDGSENLRLESLLPQRLEQDQRHAIRQVQRT